VGVSEQEAAVHAGGAAPAVTRAAPAAAPVPEARRPRRRGWLVRRMLLLADVVGLSVAFLVAEAVMQVRGWPVDLSYEALLFAGTLPVWVLMARMYGLYARDEERTDHSTVDELLGVFHLATVGAWLLFAVLWLTNVASPPLGKVFTFWLITTLSIGIARAGARTLARRHRYYNQNAVIVGAGEVGQLVARKLLQHPEYGIKVVGFVDAQPRERREDVAEVGILGSPEKLREIVRGNDVERVLIAFSQDSDESTLELLRLLRDEDVQIDVVPRLFEVVGPNAELHSVEGLPLLGLPPVRLSRSSRALKRVVDIVGASVGLLLAAPLFAYAAWRIRRESPGPVFFRQERLGTRMRPFMMLKFRTMCVETDDADHRAFIRATMSSQALPTANGLYKLDRDQAVTPFGRWLRKTSLDELPQLVNVLRGDMSLVGPRPCLAYETEHFEPHHYERFFMPPGLTGLWQVTARAHSTFGEALDMDVAYVRGWWFGLDLWLLLRTPLQMLRGRNGTA
jgi:exopolysaccharide biosynthesis polyprenyl glycosylphosphotransferase